jgi:pimeloyl-ACP methyl ester carboxylesterase
MTSIVSKNDFDTALYVLHELTDPAAFVHKPIQFSKKYAGQFRITTALNIINQCAIEGTQEQRDQLLAVRHKIIVLNSQLKQGSIRVEASRLGIHLPEEEAQRIQGMQLALPQTRCEKMLAAATLIPRLFITVLLDLLLLPGALVLLIMACAKLKFNPQGDAIKQKKAPILLLHGSGFNDMEWVIGRQFLKKKEYGSVYSLNYDGLVSNDPQKGIDDYAQEKIRPMIQRILEETQSDQVILVGHSMGGMIAGYYAENYAQEDRVHVEHVLSIASPWHGTPTIDNSWKLGGSCSREKETVRHQQMSLTGGTDEDPGFRQRLVAQALRSERSGIRKYYNICSTTDYAVPRRQGILTENPSRQRVFNFLGHYALVAWPSVWFQMRTWLNQIYTTETLQQPQRARRSADVPACQTT